MYCYNIKVNTYEKAYPISVLLHINKLLKVGIITADVNKFSLRLGSGQLRDIML